MILKTLKKQILKLLLCIIICTFMLAIDYRAWCLAPSSKLSSENQSLATFLDLNPDTLPKDLRLAVQAAQNQILRNKQQEDSSAQRFNKQQRRLAEELLEIDQKLPERLIRRYDLSLQTPQNRNDSQQYLSALKQELEVIQSTHDENLTKLRQERSSYQTQRADLSIEQEDSMYWQQEHYDHEEEVLTNQQIDGLSEAEQALSNEITRLEEEIAEIEDHLKSIDTLDKDLYKTLLLKRNNIAGKIAENLIEFLWGKEGLSQSSYMIYEQDIDQKTIVKQRIPDLVTVKAGFTVFHEVKTGSFNDSWLKELKKDLQLFEQGKVDAFVWHLFKTTSDDPLPSYDNELSQMKAILNNTANKLQREIPFQVYIYEKPLVQIDNLINRQEFEQQFPYPENFWLKLLQHGWLEPYDPWERISLPYTNIHRFAKVLKTPGYRLSFLKNEELEKEVKQFIFKSAYRHRQGFYLTDPQGYDAYLAHDGILIKDLSPQISDLDTLTTSLAEAFPNQFPNVLRIQQQKEKNHKQDQEHIQQILTQTQFGRSFYQSWGILQNKPKQWHYPFNQKQFRQYAKHHLPWSFIQAYQWLHEEFSDWKKTPDYSIALIALLFPEQTFLLMGIIGSYQKVFNPSIMEKKQLYQFKATIHHILSRNSYTQKLLDEVLEYLKTYIPEHISNLDEWSLQYEKIPPSKYVSSSEDFGLSDFGHYS